MAVDRGWQGAHAAVGTVPIGTDREGGWLLAPRDTGGRARGSWNQPSRASGGCAALGVDAVGLLLARVVGKAVPLRDAAVRDADRPTRGLPGARAAVPAAPLRQDEHEDDERRRAAGLLDPGAAGQRPLDREL